MASRAISSVTPSISKITFPGRTTATHPSGAPFPLPMRVSAGFLVTGLSGKIRIHILPPRFTKRVMATRPASICLSVIQPHSMIFRPKSPKLTLLPRWAFPRRRPRICFRYFTFFGISMSQPQSRRSRGGPGAFALRGPCPDFALVNPNLHADGAVGGAGLRESVVDVRAQSVQGQLALQVPLGAGDLRPAKPP